MTANHSTPMAYTVAEAAEILRVKESWLERQAAARKIPFTMLGGAYHFTMDHLAAIVQLHETIPSASGSGPIRRPRTWRASDPGQAEAGGIAPLRARPPGRRSGGGVTGPSAA